MITYLGENYYDEDYDDIMGIDDDDIDEEIDLLGRSRRAKKRRARRKARRSARKARRSGRKGRGRPTSRRAMAPSSASSTIAATAKINPMLLIVGGIGLFFLLRKKRG